MRLLGPIELSVQRFLSVREVSRVANRPSTKIGGY